MASERMKNLSSLLSEGKTRTIIIFTGIIIVTAVGIGVTGLMKKTSSSSTAGAKVASTPSIASVPGTTVTTQDYAKLQQQANARFAVVHESFQNPQRNSNTVELF